LLRRAAGAIRGVAYIAPMAVGDARLQLTQVRFTLRRVGHAVRYDCDDRRAVQGRRWTGCCFGERALCRRRLSFGESCTPIGFARFGQSCGLATQLRSAHWTRLALEGAGGAVQGGALFPSRALRGASAIADHAGADQLRLRC
jgi:hypothetical protein